MANTGRRQPALETHSRQLLFASAQRFQRNVLARRRDWGVLLLNKHVMIVRISFNLLQKKTQQQQSGQASRKAAFWEAACCPYPAFGTGAFACRMRCLRLDTARSLGSYVSPGYSSRVSVSKVTVHLFKDRALSSCMLIYWRLWVASQPQRGRLPLGAGSESHSFKETNILIVPPPGTVLF